MSEWRETTLGEVADLLVGYAFKSTDFTVCSEDVRLLRGVNIAQGSLDWRHSAYWPLRSAHGSKYHLRAGDVVLAMDRPWIEAGLKRSRLRQEDLPALLVQRVCRLRGTCEAQTSFINHLISSEDFSRYIQAIVTGATVPHVSQSQIAAYQVRVPTISHQDRICGILDAIDDLIENNRLRVELLEQMAQSIYWEWFVHFRYPGHEEATIVDSPLGPIPEGWEVTTIAECAQALTRGISPKYAEDGAWTVLNQKCIRNQRVSLERARRQERAVPPAKQIQFGDVLINSTGVGTLGRIAIFLGDHPALTVDSHVTLVRPSDPLANPWFGMNLLGLQAHFEALGTGSTGQTELSRKDIGATALVHPPPGLRRCFAESVWPMLTDTTQLLDQNRRLAGIRDLLLPKLVTGQIDVSNLDLDALAESVA